MRIQGVYTTHACVLRHYYIDNYYSRTCMRGGQIYIYHALFIYFAPLLDLKRAKHTHTHTPAVADARLVEGLLLEPTIGAGQAPKAVAAFRNTGVCCADELVVSMY